MAKSRRLHHLGIAAALALVIAAGVYLLYAPDEPSSAMLTVDADIGDQPAENISVTLDGMPWHECRVFPCKVEVLIGHTVHVEVWTPRGSGSHKALVDRDMSVQVPMQIAPRRDVGERMEEILEPLPSAATPTARASG